MSNTNIITVQIPLVTIICLTYNQSNYIRQTLESLLMQRTSFLFEILVHDDASTDGTKKIIEEYVTNFPHIVKAIFQEQNRFSIHGINFLYDSILPEVKGKYIAVCEGDDFWIDPLKLQKQVSFLELNPDYGLVHTKAVKFSQEKQIFKGLIGFDVIDFESLIYENTIANLTSCYRYSLVLEYLDKIKPQTRTTWTSPDFAQWLWFAQHSKIKFLDDITAAYRIINSSVSHIKSDSKRLVFVEGVYDIVDFYLSNTSIKVNEKKIRARYYSNIIKMYFLTRKWDKIRTSVKIFYDANDWFNLLWIMITLPFAYSKFLVKGSYRVRSIVFDLCNIYPIRK